MLLILIVLSEPMSGLLEKISVFLIFCCFVRFDGMMKGKLNSGLFFPYIFVVPLI